MHNPELLPLVSAPSLLPDGCHDDVRLLVAGRLMRKRNMYAPRILVLDSGLGGLTVFREVAKTRPDARFLYVADDAAFPYGRIEPEKLVEHVLALVERLIEIHEPDLAVIACNTASTIALPSLRARFAVPFVGTVPAIKPACAASRTKRVSVLGTEATVKREYTHALIREFAAGCEVTLVGSARLAALAETELQGGGVEDAAIAAELAPCFVENGARTDTIVLACTHYPLLIDRIERLASWPVAFIDPAPAIARRVVDLLGPAQIAAAPGAARAIFTSGRDISAGLLATLRRFGLGEIAAQVPRTRSSHVIAASAVANLGFKKRH
jgi:glutamate racemase